MKITKFLVLSFFLFGFTTSSFPEAIQDKDLEVVVDIFGNEVRANASYFIKAFLADNTTTLVVSSEGTCPPDIRLSTISNKVPMSITPVRNDSVIYEDTYVNFNLVKGIICLRSDVTGMWKVSYNTNMDRYIVTTGGMGPLKRFKITKYRADNGLYELSYYPVCEPFIKLLGVKVGYLVGDEVTYLAPNANPVRFAFEPYPDEAPKIEYKKVSE